MSIIFNGVKYELYHYKNEREMERFVVENSKSIFGENSFYFSVKKRIESKKRIGTIPDGYLLNLDSDRFYIVEVELKEHDVLKHISGQLLGFDLAFRNDNSKKEIIKILLDEIDNDPIKMKKINVKTFFATILVCLTAFAGEEVRYYRYKDDKGTVTFTDNPTSVPEKFKDRVQTIIMEESESPGEAGRYYIMNQQGAKKEYLDDNGHGEAWWRSYIQTWNNKLKEAQKKVEESRKRYFTDPTLDVFAKKRLQEEITKYEEEVKEAERMLRDVIPEEARKAGALPGWLRLENNE